MQKKKTIKYYYILKFKNSNKSIIKKYISFNFKLNYNTIKKKINKIVKFNNLFLRTNII